MAGRKHSEIVTEKKFPIAKGYKCPGCGGPMKHNREFVWCAEAPGHCKEKNKPTTYFGER